MNDAPFENFLAHFARNYGSETLSRVELEQTGWPVPLPYLTASGLKPRKRTGYRVSDLIAYSRLHSIPGEGIIRKTIIRPSYILAKERDSITGQYTVIHIAAGYSDPGCLTFLCPFCGNLHVHGTGPGGYGDGDGPRIPHCLDRDHPTFMRRDISPLAKQLAPHWQFNLTEVKHHDLLGDIPHSIKKRLLVRHNQGGNA